MESVRLDDGLRHLDEALAFEETEIPGPGGRFLTSLENWAFAVAGRGEVNPRKLPEVAQTVMVLDWLASEILSGGLDFWIVESFKIRDIDLVEAAAQRVGAMQTLAAMRAVRGLFPQGIPVTREECEVAGEALRAEPDEPIERIHDEYGRAIPGEVVKCLMGFVRSRAEQARDELRMACSEAERQPKRPRRLP